MSNPLKYVTSTPTGTLRHANLGAGVASIQYDETFTSGINPTFASYYLVYEPVEGSTPRIYAPANSTELIALAKSKGSTATSEAGALCFLSENGYYPANRVLENIVTDDLKLFFDPQSATSYPDATSDYILDLSGEGEDGYLYNGTSFDASDDTLDFDGVNDYLLTDTNVTITGDQSIETFIKFDSLEGFLQGLISNHDYVNTSNFGINQVASNKIAISIGYTNGTREYQDKRSNTSVVTGRYYHIVMTFNLSANQCKLYIDGELDATFNLTKTVKYTSRPMVLGRWDYQYNSYYFDGNIAASKYYSKTLSAEEVKQNYYQGPFDKDYLTYAFDAGNLVSSKPGTTSVFSLTGSLGAASDGTLVNGTTYNGSANGNWSFDGVDDGLTLAGNISLGNGNVAWTVEAWVRSTTTVNGLGQGPIATNDGSGPVYSVMSINAGKMCYWTYYSGWYQTLGVATINDGEWHYLTWVNYTNSTMDMYVDGSFDKNVAISTSGNNNPIDSIGKSWTARFDGDIASVYFYQGRSLTSVEVQQNYNANVKKYT